MNHRNPQPVLDAICKVWQKYPDLRVGQIISSSLPAEAHAHSILFNLENLELAALIMDKFEIEND